MSKKNKAERIDALLAKVTELVDLLSPDAPVFTGWEAEAPEQVTYPTEFSGIEATPFNAEEVEARETFGGIFATPDTSETSRWAESLDAAQMEFSRRSGVHVDPEGWASSPMRLAALAIIELAFDQFEAVVVSDLKNDLALAVSNMTIDLPASPATNPLEGPIAIRDQIADFLRS